MRKLTGVITAMTLALFGTVVAAEPAHAVAPTPKVCTGSTVLPTSTNVDPLGWGDLKNAKYVDGGIQLTATATVEAYAYVDFTAVPLSQIGDLSTSFSNATGSFGIILGGEANIHYEGGAYWTKTPNVFPSQGDGVYGAPDLNNLLSDPGINEVAVWVNPGGSLLLHSQNYGCQTQPFNFLQPVVVAHTPAITGSPTIGSILTADPGTWTPADATLSYQWILDGKTNIAGATAVTYTPVAADSGHTLAVRMTGTKDGYTSATALSPAVIVAPAPGAFQSLSPTRLLDTRVTDGKIGPAQTRTLQVTGVGGVPSTGVSAVVLNVTVTETTSGGYLTVSPTGTTRPTVSNLNWSNGDTIPNAVTVKVGTNGMVDLYQSGPGAAQVIVDVAGYYVDGAVVEAGGFTALAPSRILDSRVVGGKFVSGEARELQILGMGGVPVSDVSAVVLNVTVTETTSGGYLTVYPSGTPKPTASNLNWSGGLTIPNLAVVKVGASGKVSLFQSGPGTAQVIVDVAGYYVGGDAKVLGMFVALAPSRVLDTRGTTPVLPNSNEVLPILNKGGVPSTGVSAVVMNTTVTETKAPGYLTVFPGSSVLPTASNLNWSGAGSTIPNLVTVQVGTDGNVTFRNGSTGTTQVIADTAGYYIGI